MYVIDFLKLALLSDFAHDAHAMRGLLDTMPTTLAGVREAMQYFNCGASRCRFPLRTDPRISTEK